MAGRSGSPMNVRIDRIADRVARRIEDRFVYAFRSSLYLLVTVTIAIIFVLYYLWQLTATYAALTALVEREEFLSISPERLTAPQGQLFEQ